MSPDQRYGLLMAALGIIAAMIGYAGKRIVARQDAARERLEALWIGQGSPAASAWQGRMDRTELAMAKLLEIVTEQGLQMARHEGWHESHDKAEDDLMGRRGD